MAYVVLARKYRPQRFADLVGQEHVTRTLANAIAHDRVHHAYLFCGARGLGKTTAARLLAKCLVCVQGPTIEPCNVCSECVAVTEGRSVDVIEIDGASNNKVEDVRGIRDQVRYLPQSARRKIYIIDEVHMLTGSAFNALLKTLEEPPEHVTFIFATTEVHELPATILSRVSRFDFRRLSSAQLVGHLQRILASEGVSVEEAGLYTVARAGDGSVRDSLTLLDKVIAFASDTRKIGADEVRVVLGVPSTLAVAGLVEAVLARDPTLTLRRFDEVFASGQDLLALSLEFLKHLRDLMIVKLCGTKEVLVDTSDAEFEQLKVQASGVESVALAQLFDRFTRVVDALPRTRVPRLVLEMGLLDLVHSDPLVPLGDLIDRLEQISSGAPVGGGNSALRGGSVGSSSGRPGPVGEPPRRAEALVPPTRGVALPGDDSSPFSKILAPLLTGGGGLAENRVPEPSRGSPAGRSAAETRPAPTRPPADIPGVSAGPRTAPVAAPWEPGARPSAPQTAESRAVSSAPTAEARAGSAATSRSAGGAGDDPPPWPDDPAWTQGDTSAPRSRPTETNVPPLAGPGRQEPTSPAPARPAADRAGMDFRTTSGEPRSAAAVPATSGNIMDAPQRSADCGGCPGAPQAEQGGLIPWATMPAFTAWEQFLARLRADEAALFAFLGDLGLMKLGEGVVRLAGSAHQFARGHLRDQAELRSLVESLLHQHLGAPFKLELAEGEPTLPELPCLKLDDLPRHEQLQEEVEKEAQAHPQIQALMAQFDAQVRNVRPRGASPSRGL